ncbi:MAG: tRNA pseudouridine(38-40) synthase TruA [Thermodesulfobacteriota bacterium]
MPRLKLTVAYDGAGFSGWQVQARRSGPSERTVQGVLEAVVAPMLGRPARITGAGRTDAGVHALGQVCHFDVPAEKLGLPWQRALNAQLPEDVSVLAVARVDSSFSARFSATDKTYAYTLWPFRDFRIPQRRGYAWACGPVDRDAMRAAADLLTGEHDFKSFQNTGTRVASTVRTLTDISWSPGLFPGEAVWRFTADGFLKQMVRNLMGLLVWVGQGKFTPGQARDIMESRSRNIHYPTAPAHGLCLEEVRY